MPFADELNLLFDALDTAAGSAEEATVLYENVVRTGKIYKTGPLHFWLSDRSRVFSGAIYEVELSGQNLFTKPSN